MPLPRWAGRLLLLLAGGALTAEAIYPDGHFDHVTKINDADHLNTVISETLSADQTLMQAPAWNQATRAFAGNTNVRFADINLSEAPVRGEPYNPGAGGWPTIRYFNKSTGEEGAPYDKKTDKPMCQELGDFDMMVDYIEEAGGTALCALDGAGCDERSLKYLEKMKEKTPVELQGEIERMEGMEGDSMTEELRGWLSERRKLVKRLLTSKEGKDEL